MPSPAPRGAVASGHPETTAAGLQALALGGNAVDAVVAAALAATVAEPLLTGFGGGGLMTVREGATGRVSVLLFFSVFPGLRDGLEPRDFQALDVSYGPTIQRFHAGRGAVAVPGVAQGLEEAARRWGRLDLPSLAGPAIRVAREGWILSPQAEVVTTMLAPITGLTPGSRALFWRDGRPLSAGARFQHPGMARALEAFASEGSAPFVSGELGRALVEGFGPPHGSLSMEDLEAFRPQLVEPLRAPIGRMELFVPPPPCAGGALLDFGLRLLGRLPPPRDAVEEAATIAAVQAESEEARRAGWDERMFHPGAVEALLDPESLERHADSARRRLTERGFGPPTPPRGAQPGNTTHISAVDAEGNAAAYTSSNGETCGTLWPGCDLPVNNFLGEEDIHPLGFHRGPPGAPMRTMMTPSLLVGPDGSVAALGTGGSNRIRTAMLQVVQRVAVLGEDLEDAILAPRIHVEGGAAQVEDLGQGEAWFAAAAGGLRMARFTGRHLYFGGVHAAAGGPGGLEAVGDPRRNGAGGTI